ncbi:hypothetical protein BDQ17DRAFT_1340889, partial [Cyathus striatus]
MDHESSLSESTPLLSPPSNASLRENHFPHFPPVAVAVQRILELERLIVDEDLFADSSPIQGPANEYTVAISTAYALVILLEARKRKQTLIPTGYDIYKDWVSITKVKTQESLLEDAITRRWTSFISEYRSIVELDILFWTTFPYTNAISKSQLRGIS